MKKLLLLLAGILTAIICLSGIFGLFTILQYSDFQQGKTIVIIIFLLVIAGFGLAAFKCFKSIPHKDRTERNPETVTLPVTEVSADPPVSSVLDTTPVNEHSVEYIESANSIQRVDNKPISNEEVSYLIQAGYESTQKREKTRLERTSREEDLCINFMMNHSADIQCHVAKFEDLCDKAYSEQRLDMRIKLLQQTILEYEKAKKWFYQTQGGKIYFEDMYEHLHNSQNENFSYIDSVQEHLDYWIEKRDVIIPQIFSAIGDNGIIQKNIYELILIRQMYKRLFVNLNLKIK